MLLLALLAVVGSLRGTVAAADYPLPGAVVTLASKSFTAVRVADAQGKYEFRCVPPGDYDVAYELAGFPTVRRSVTVREGENAMPRVDMRVVDGQVIVVGCTLRMTCVKSPRSPWDLPACSDYELDTALIDSAKSGDHSAIDLLQRRYATTFTHAERIRIGSFLLGRIRDDSAIWNELRIHAENAIEFAGHREKLEAYCIEHGYDPNAYEWMAWRTFDSIRDDPRSRPLVVRALAISRSASPAQ